MKAKRIALTLVVASGVLVPAENALGQALFLDTRKDTSRKYAGPVKTQKLRFNRRYVVTVRGTFSSYDRGAWRKALCGSPEKAPLYKSKGARNGRVGTDPEWIFADKATKCDAKHPPVRAWNGFELSLRKRSPYFELGPPMSDTGIAPTGPDPAHTYDYAVVGLGKPVRIRLADPNTRDNYGRLKLTVRKGTAADCPFNWALLGYASEAECVAAGGHRAPPAPAPALASATAR